MCQEKKYEKGESNMNACVMKPSMPFVTKSELKRTPATAENRKMAQFMDSHEFSFSINRVSKELQSSVTLKGER